MVFVKLVMLLVKNVMELKPTNVMLVMKIQIEHSIVLQKHVHQIIIVSKINKKLLNVVTNIVIIVQVKK